MAHLFIFDPETASKDERRNFFDFLKRTGKLEVEEAPDPSSQGGYCIKGKIFERLPFQVWGFEKDYAILQAIREYRRILMTVGTIVPDEKESQGGNGS